MYIISNKLHLKVCKRSSKIHYSFYTIHFAPPFIIREITIISEQIGLYRRNQFLQKCKLVFYILFYKPHHGFH